MSSNGMADILPNMVNMTKGSLKFILNQTLNDQFVQEYQSKMAKSFSTLNLCNTDQKYRYSEYLDIIRNVDIRNVFTRLRINHCKLNAYIHKEGHKNCSKCDVLEDTQHLLLDCTKEIFEQHRMNFYNNMRNLVPNFIYLPKDNMLEQILNLNFYCSRDVLDSAIKIACNFVKKMYNSRFPL